jgi:hypothetical protein
MCLLGPGWLDYYEKELKHSENGPWEFVGTIRRPGHFPGCYFRSFGAKKLLVPMWGLKRNPLYINTPIRSTRLLVPVDRATATYYKIPYYTESVQFQPPLRGTRSRLQAF